MRLAREVAGARSMATSLHCAGRVLRARAPGADAPDLGRRATARCARAMRWPRFTSRPTPSDDATPPALPVAGEASEPERAFAAARDTRQPVYSRAFRDASGTRGVPAPGAAARARQLRRRADRRILDRRLLRYFGAAGSDAAPHRGRARRTAAACWPARVTADAGPAPRSRPTDRLRPAAGAGGQRPGAARPGLPHLGRPGRQHAVLDGRGAVGADGLDAARHLAPHAPAQPDAERAGAGNQLPPRDGKLDADRHARDGHARAASPTSTRRSAR